MRCMGVDDPETLRRLYWDKGLTIHEVADELGSSAATVYRRMDKFDIKRRGRGSDVKCPNVHTDTQGYEFVLEHVDGKQYRFLIHRLLAISEYGYDKVHENVVHHKNGLKWDNRPDNIEVMSNREHSLLHNC